MNEWLRFAVAALATWRVTHLIVYENGPWDVMANLRRRAGAGFFGKLMDCFYCASLWVAAPVAFALEARPVDWLLLWLAISGAACLLNRVGQEPVLVESLSDNSGGTDDALLRTESGEGDAGGSTGAR